MWTETLILGAGFDKSDVYSAFNGMVQTITIRMKGQKENNKENGKRKDSTMNKSKS